MLALAARRSSAARSLLPAAHAPPKALKHIRTRHLVHVLALLERVRKPGEVSGERGAVAYVRGADSRDFRRVLERFELLCR
jgi:hypothetical protein